MLRPDVERDNVPQTAMGQRWLTPFEIGLRVIAGACALLAVGLSLQAILIATAPGMSPGRVWLVRWAYFGATAGLFSWRAIRGGGLQPFVFGMLAASWLLDSTGLTLATTVVLVVLCVLACGLRWVKSMLWTLELKRTRLRRGADRDKGRLRSGPVHFDDLSPYQHGGREPDPSIVNVGWLAFGHPYEEGRVPQGFVDALRRLVWTPVNLFRGFHVCEYCLKPRVRNGVRSYEPGSGVMGNGEIRVRGRDGVIYVAPILVFHYVQVHRYRPPRVFVDAVLAHR